MCNKAQRKNCKYNCKRKGCIFYFACFLYTLAILLAVIGLGIDEETVITTTFHDPFGYTKYIFILFYFILFLFFEA